MLRPLQPLDLKEHEHVLVSVVKTAASERSSLAVEYIERIRRQQQDAEPAPGLEEVRRRLRKFPDPWPLKSSPTAGNVDPWPRISSLVKLYHPEAGTLVADRIFNSTDNVIRVSRLTVAELTGCAAGNRWLGRH